jgi:hypothetical protein
MIAAALLAASLSASAQTFKSFPDPISLPASIFLPAPSDDLDHDGLHDGLEDLLAFAVRPYLVFDSRENALLSWEPVTLFQVRPIGCAGPRSRCGGAPAKIEVVFLNLWQHDGGYADSFFCSDRHHGDNQVVGPIILESADDGHTFRIVSITNWDFVWPTHSGAIRLLDGTHVSVYMSAGKHHQFFDTFENEKPSRYSNWGCTDAVDGKGRAVLSRVVSPGATPVWNNVGEPESHPAGAFVFDLGSRGYPGENAWDEKQFCGGVGCEKHQETSKNSGAWSHQTFFVPEGPSLY